MWTAAATMHTSNETLCLQIVAGISEAGQCPAKLVRHCVGQHEGFIASVIALQNCQQRDSVWEAGGDRIDNIVGELHPWSDQEVAVLDLILPRLSCRFLDLDEIHDGLLEVLIGGFGLTDELLYRST